jgi:hypothetical protein
MFDAFRLALRFYHFEDSGTNDTLKPFAFYEYNSKVILYEQQEVISHHSCHFINYNLEMHTVNI